MISGRVHRFLILEALVEWGAVECGALIPVSVTMLAKIRDYDAALRGYSQPVRVTAEEIAGVSFALELTEPFSLSNCVGRVVSAEVKGFMLNVTDVNEESITDYLVWKWRELDARFKYINIRAYTRQEENTTTGADLELQLWLVGRSRYLPLVIQAKKLVKTFDSYVRKLSYPDGTKGQLDTMA